MNAVEIIRTNVVSAIRPATVDLEVESLVANYLVAKESIEEFVDVQVVIKRRLREIVDSTGQNVWDVRSGKIICPADATIIAYDAAALDRLGDASRHFRLKVSPFRSETVRSGGIRINGR